MAVWLMAGLTLVLGVDAQVQPLSGAVQAGQLQSLSGEQLVLLTDDGQQTFAVRDLMNVKFNDPLSVPTTGASTWVQLTDGTQLVAGELSAADGQVALQLTSGRPLKLSTAQVQSVRLHEASEEFNEAWNQLLAASPAGDRVIVRRDKQLVPLEGVVYDIDAEFVQFEFDGQRIPVARSKLEGVMFFHQQAAQSRPTLARLTDGFGCTWVVTSLAMSDDVLNGQTVAGVDWSLPLTDLRQIDFSSSNIVYLSDLAPERFTWAPFLESSLTASRLTKMFAPRSDQSLEGGPLQLGFRDGRSIEYAKGLAIHSRTELVYRLTDSYRSLQAVVGIDNRLRPAGHVEVTIFDDTRPIWQQTITGKDQPIELDLDIRGVRRLKILVDFGDDMDIADHLNLCDARIVK